MNCDLIDEALVLGREELAEHPLEARAEALVEGGEEDRVLLELGDASSSAKEAAERARSPSTRMPLKDFAWASSAFFFSADGEAAQQLLAQRRGRRRRNPRGGPPRRARGRRAARSASSANLRLMSLMASSRLPIAMSASIGSPGMTIWRMLELVALPVVFGQVLEAGEDLAARLVELAASSRR